MDNASLFRLYQEYDPEKDLSGNWRVYLVNEILRRCGGHENFARWLMLARLSTLEKEALEREKLEKITS